MLAVWRCVVSQNDPLSLVALLRSAHTEAASNRGATVSKFSIKRAVTRMAAFASVLVVIISLQAGQSFAAQSFAQSNAADIGVSENGTVRPTGWNQPGECIKSVQRWINTAGGRMVGGGPYSAYVNSPADLITTNSGALVALAAKGDVIQYTYNPNRDSYAPGVHTVMVVNNNRNGTLKIVQSNIPQGSGRVSVVDNWRPAPPTNFTAYLWRFGYRSGPNGAAGGAKLVGDWDGNGTDTIAAVYSTPNGLQWHIRNSNNPGPADAIFYYGNPSDTPVVGNWDGVGGDTIGVARAVNGGLEWHIRNYNSSGPANGIFFYGNASDVPVVGNWDGVGGDTIGVTRAVNGGLEWHIRNYNSSGPANGIFFYGNASDVPIVGNWDGVGGDTIGVTRAVNGGREWHIRNYNSSGPANGIFFYGNDSDMAIAGNWDRAGGDTIGVLRRTASGMEWHIRNYNSPGPANGIFFYGDSSRSIG
jgi:hypothetical protein